MNNKEQLNFQELFLDLLSGLTDREQEVLKKRYQLTADLENKQTLKQIGDFYGITRERVRQIEREAVNKLLNFAKQVKYQQSLEKMKNALITYLERKGGLASEDELIKEHTLANYDFDTLHLNSFLFVLEHLVNEISKQSDSADFYAFWRLNHINHDLIVQFIEKVVQSLKSKDAVISEEKLFQMIEKEVVKNMQDEFLKLILDKYGDLNVADFIKSYLAITKKVEKNILQHWGLADWPQIKPKKLADKILLIFERSQDPLHFREVAEQINSAGFDRKKICAATVHNELIANSRYILIGRGIYALKEWGYTSGTVADVIIDILKKKQKAMSKDEIYQEVLKQRKVNPSTIYLSLISKDTFKKLANGLFELNQ